MAVSNNPKFQIPKAFLDESGNRIADLHIHTKCGKSAPMEVFRIMKDGKRFFKCPNCKYLDERTITVRPELRFNRAKNDFFEKTLPQHQRLAEEYHTLESRSAELEKRIQALEVYQLAKKEFKDKDYDGAVEACIQALKLCCSDGITTQKLEKLLSNAHTQRVNKYLENMDDLTKMHEETLGDENKMAVRMYNKLILQSLNYLGLAKKQMADYYYQVDKVSEARETFEATRHDFETALNLKPLQDTDTAISMNLAEVYLSLANIYQIPIQYDYSKSIECYQKSIQLQEKILENFHETARIEPMKTTLNNSYLDMCDVYIKLSDKFIEKSDETQGVELLRKCREELKKIDEKYVHERVLGATKMLLSLKFLSFKDEDSDSGEK
ncbi:MAG: hypothetical protein K940chlam1_00412 [Candidatus Anoxychlamydiales bacterium]|nr:hypothetical protein [Candidatus Anoxychlamydiales bacterium]NGX35887.1 hypothetical protein [Candidatus Anoxychlamydiales bacterium]